MEIKKIKKAKIKEFKDEWKQSNREIGFDWKKKEYFFGVFDGDDIAGYVYITINGGVGYLKDIIVKKVFRRKGLGKTLLDFFEEFCKNKGCHKLTIKTSEKHGPALKLYEKAGYKIEGEMKNDRFNVTWFNMYKFVK